MTLHSIHLNSNTIVGPTCNIVAMESSEVTRSTPESGASTLLIQHSAGLQIVC